MDKLVVLLFLGLGVVVLIGSALYAESRIPFGKVPLDERLRRILDIKDVKKRQRIISKVIKNDRG